MDLKDPLDTCKPTAAARPPPAHPPTDRPPTDRRPGGARGSAGGEPVTVLVGYVSNLALLALFTNFYRRTYRARKRPKEA